MAANIYIPQGVRTLNKAMRVLGAAGTVSDGSNRGTQVNGINDYGDIVGRYDLNNIGHGFVYLNQQTVSIAIKPGAVPASINTQSRGTIPVAILSAANFDATSLVNRTSLTFGHSGKREQLVILQRWRRRRQWRWFSRPALSLLDAAHRFQLGDTMGVLNGKTTDGAAFQGTASIQIVH